MRFRLLAGAFAFCFVASIQAQTLTIDKLVAFVKSQLELNKEGKGTDKQLAQSLAKVKLTEKLDASVIEDLEGQGAGPATLRALQLLQEQSKALTAVKLIPPPVYVQEPPPSSIEQGRILDDVRKYVANYDESLPDFICLEKERRQIAARPGTRYAGRSNEPEFTEMDTIFSKMTYFNHKEEKTLILQNNKPVTFSYADLGGATSTGDFAISLRTLFEPATEARFEWNRWATLRKRNTMVFDFRVEQSRSKYAIVVKDAHQQIVTGYVGELFVDTETHAVTRLKLRAVDLPPSFPVRAAESTLDYQYTDIGGQEFLLPLYGEVKMDGSDTLTRNLLEFQQYRKYEVGSSVSFDVKTEIPADQLKETPAKPPVDCKDPKNKDAAECKK